jgi:hypothetical protein
VFFRNTPYAGGALFAPLAPNVPPIDVTDAETLGAVLGDIQRVRVLKGGNVTRREVPRGHLSRMLKSEAFLGGLPPVDRIDTTPVYLPDFTLTSTGYNNGGRGQRFLYFRDKPWVKSTFETIARFLDAMCFESDSDRINIVAAALTVMLRNHWLGTNPCLLVTSTKCHGGKETVVKFAAGNTRHTSISYEPTDRAFQKAFVATVRHEPSLGMINVENARLGRGVPAISSAFLERYLTDPEPTLYSPQAGRP